MKTIIIVDPLSSGRFYAPYFKKLGINCVAVISDPNMSPRFLNTLIPEDFSAIYHWEEALLSTLDELSALGVVAGCETAIYLTDYLTETLGLNGNSRNTSDFRRNKFSMQNALKSKGLPGITSKILSSRSQIPGFMETVDPERDYVIKPINSASTDGVVFAKGTAQVHAALINAAWHQKNDLGEENLGFIVQPFIEGPEYVVDMVAYDGTMVIASVCRYSKVERNGSKFVYEGLDTLDPADITLKPLLDYARQAAAALGIRVGPIHMEIIWSDQGPVMIEAGARLHGGIAPLLFTNVYKPDLLSLAVDCYLGTPAPHNMTAVKQINHGRIGFFYADTATRFNGPSEADLADATNNIAYGGHRYFLAPGDVTKVTVDFATCPGLFWVYHPEPAQLSHSAETLRQLLWRE